MARPAAVGARELKARLGTYLRRVQHGERLVVTDRGRPVAEIRPIGPELEDLDARLARLEAAGTLTRPTRSGLRSFRAIVRSGRPVSEIIADDREDRL